ncbi:MAG: sigma-70 family RNA polymerase sigma factor [Planctomycetes bacterium]|nr:sigma-70 family RNA polymerase sigma factor [Planctomycetota bacterium]
MSDDAQGGPQRFPTTHWSLVGRAGAQADSSQRVALDELLRRYWPALRAYLVRKRGIESNEADDLVQGFIESKILERNLIGAAEQSRGRFRNLLATALDNYVHNQHQRRSAKKRTADRAVRLDAGEDHWAVDRHTPQNALDVAWSRELLAEVLRRVRLECEQSDRNDLWEVLDLRVLSPILHGDDPLPYEAIVQRFGYQSPTQAANALITAKRMFGRLLRAVISEYSADDADVEEEIRDLHNTLAGAPR